jgi:hypothetical protein
LNQKSLRGVRSDRMRCKPRNIVTVKERSGRAPAHVWKWGKSGCLRECNVRGKASASEPLWAHNHLVKGSTGEVLDYLGIGSLLEVSEPRDRGAKRFAGLIASERNYCRQEFRSSRDDGVMLVEPDF